MHPSSKSIIEYSGVALLHEPPQGGYVACRLTRGANQPRLQAMKGRSGFIGVVFGRLLAPVVEHLKGNSLVDAYACDGEEQPPTADLCGWAGSGAGQPQNAGRLQQDPRCLHLGEAD